MALVYRSICNEADTLLMHITKLAEKEIKYKLEIEKQMNAGFINIAKARYIMGSTCVTKMQLPTADSNRIKPVATVCRAELNDHWVFHIHRKDIDKGKENSSSQKINEDLKPEENKSTEDCDDKKVIDNSAEVKFRKLQQSGGNALKKTKIALDIDDKVFQDYNEELLDEMSDSGSTNSELSVEDPIRLFGILVPSSLKQGQVAFQNVINLVAKCATLHSELTETLHKYNNLEKVKKLIEAAAKEIKMNISKPRVYWTPSETSSISCHSIEEKEGSEKDEESESKVSIQKSIRSVFYDLKEIEAKEAELSNWGSDELIDPDQEEN